MYSNRDLISPLGFLLSEQSHHPIFRATPVVHLFDSCERPLELDPMSWGSSTCRTPVDNMAGNSFLDAPARAIPYLLGWLATQDMKPFHQCTVAG